MSFRASIPLERVRKLARAPRHARASAAVSMWAALVATAIAWPPARAAGPPQDVANPGTANGAVAPFFVIGIDAQPPELLARWARTGVNTTVRVAGGATAETDATARALGLRAIRPLGPGETGLGLSHLVAVASPSDEPELKHLDADAGTAVQATFYAAERVRGLPFFTNYAGPWMRDDPFGAKDYCGFPGDRIGPDCYAAYFAQTDWISFDQYPMNRERDINEPARLVRRIREYHVQRSLAVPPVLAYVEASDFDCNGTGPTPGQIAYQAMNAVLAGANGIIYFPHALKGCARRSADGSTPDARGAMRRVNRMLSAVPAATLQSPPDPQAVEMEVHGDEGRLRTGSRIDATHAWYLSANDDDERSLLAAVTFHGLKRCDGLLATRFGNTDEAFTMPVKLDATCRTTTEQSWQPREVRVYRVPLERAVDTDSAP